VSSGCDALLQEAASDISYGATASIWNKRDKRLVRPWLRIRAFVSISCLPGILCVDGWTKKLR
jgi:hypothetical protein